MRVAVLDDYQQVARELAPWGNFLTDHVAVVARPEPYVAAYRNAVEGIEAFRRGAPVRVLV